jgi:hypothetical protein
MTRYILTILTILLLNGCATGVKVTDGFEIGVSASPSAVGVDFDVSPMRALCSFSKAVSWNWGENMTCDDVAVPEQ